MSIMPESIAPCCYAFAQYRYFFALYPDLIQLSSSA